MTDKEKLEKALVHLKKFVDGDCVCASDILADFQELAESQDGRIIKTLQEYVKNRNWPLNGPTQTEVLAWLEKQKEQKNQLEDYSRGYNDGYYHGVTDQKQKEQKPVEKQDYSGLNDLERAIHRGFLCAGVENVPVTIIKETAQECMAKIKPVEWSEDDKQWLESIIREYEERLSVDKDHAAVIQIKINFLKFLRPQPKQEWSEEDEKEYNYIMSYLDTAPKGKQNHASKWLKKRRPQPHWKPSEEQMRALGDYIDGEEISEYDMEEIVRLYNDLKKL